MLTILQRHTRKERRFVAGCFNCSISPSKIDYINAYGINLGDIAETKVTKKVFGEHAYSLKKSTKSMTGHLLGAAGGVETIFSTLAIHGCFPPTINLNKQDPEYDLDYVANKGKRWISNTHLITSIWWHKRALVLEAPSLKLRKEKPNVSP